MRNLASIQEIKNIEPIYGKDNIVLASVLGWKIIVRKDEFQIGDKCVYVEIDSILPEKPEFEFLRKNKFRIRTMKMAGVLSQGIVFPVAILENYQCRKIGTDVTNELGITKYEEDVFNVPIETKKQNKLMKYLMKFPIVRKLILPKKSNGGYPSDIEKTDETRIQSLTRLLEDKTKRYIVTEKLEGTSATYSLKRTNSLFGKFEFSVCSRNLKIPKPPILNKIIQNKDNYSILKNKYWEMAIKYDIENLLKEILNNSYNKDIYRVTIQGEIIGEGVQGNIYNIKGNSFYAFNMIFHKKYEDDVKYNTSQIDTVCSVFGGKEKIKSVPIIMTNYILPDTVDELLNLANGETVIGNTKTLREGLVFRSDDGKVSFKAVSNEYLLKRGY